MKNLLITFVILLFNSLNIFAQKTVTIGILVDQYSENTEPLDAIVSACLQRFRPIILATLTTVLGLIPLYIGGGAMWEPMAITIMIGLLFGTIVTLLFVPSIYSVLYKVDYKNYKFNNKFLK